MYQIIATPTFKVTLQRLVHFLEVKYSEEKARQISHQIKTTLTKKLAKNPEIAPLSPRLISLGINQYRQFQIDEHNIVFYKIIEKKKRVLLLAVMDSRQSLQKLLQEVALLSP